MQDKSIKVGSATLPYSYENRAWIKPGLVKNESNGFWDIPEENLIKSPFDALEYATRLSNIIDGPKLAEVIKIDTAKNRGL